MVFVQTECVLIAEDCKLNEMEVPWCLRGAIVHNMIEAWLLTSN